MAEYILTRFMSSKTLQFSPISPHITTAMLCVNMVLAGLAAIAAASPTPIKNATDALAPWEITHFSARKYSPKSHVAWINITISDPNEIKLQKVPRGYAVLPKFQANCYWTWNWFEDPFPLGIETVCTPLGVDDIYGNLTMRLQSYADYEPYPGHLDIEIIESRAVTVLGTDYIRVWKGAANLSDSDNLHLACSSSGRCGWNLRGKPVPIKQELIESLGSCETAKVGGC
jgi:hypothetical protein